MNADLDDATLRKFASKYNGMGFAVSQTLSVESRKLLFETLLATLALDDDELSTGGFQGQSRWDQLINDHFFANDYLDGSSATPIDNVNIAVGFIKFSDDDPKYTRVTARKFFEKALAVSKANRWLFEGPYVDASVGLSLLDLIEGNQQKAMKYLKDAAQSASPARFLRFFDALAKQSGMKNLQAAYEELAKETKEFTNAQGIEASLKMLKERRPEFDLDKFLQEVEKDAAVIPKAIAAGETAEIADRFSSLDVFRWWVEDALVRKTLGYTETLDIRIAGKPKITALEVTDKLASIQVELHGKQMSSIGPSGRTVFQNSVNDGDAIGIWTYELNLGDPRSSWKISSLHGI